MAVEYRCDKCKKVVDPDGTYIAENGEEYRSVRYIYLNANDSEDARMLCIDCRKKVVAFIDKNPVSTTPDRLIEYVKRVLDEAEIKHDKPIHVCRNCGLDFDKRSISLELLLEMGQELRRVTGIAQKGGYHV